MAFTISLKDVFFDDRAFVQSKISRFPVEIQKDLLRIYHQKPSRFEANSFLRDFVDQASKKLNIKLSLLNLNHDEDSLRKYSEERADICARHTLVNNNVNVNEKIDYLINYAKSYGISVNVNKSPQGIIKRSCDPIWWLRKLRKSLNRNIETINHHLNKVNRSKGIYASDWLTSQRRNQLFRHEKSMSSTFLSNDLGQIFSLKELSDKSVSNPKVRKAELMVRIRGFEETSQALGHEALFVTLSCPSKYHRSFSKTGHENPNWGGFTPLDAQGYLNNVWQRIRASLDRSQIRFYGFRVAEPHHDGTPHWHLLLFVNVNEAKPLTEIIQHYALLEDPNERGAKQHRCSFTKIDPKKGSATGYIAKYISKNIDGADIEHDSYGENAATSAERVNAWASCWGIRQFQQLGGPSVSVWREARRLKDFQTQDNKNLNELREAADRSDWQKYVELMGGVFVKRNEQLARPLYEFEIDVSTGEIKQSHYDEEPLKTIKGILSSGLKFITRHLKWTKLAFRQAPCFNLEFCQ